MFCALGHVFGCAKGVSSLFHVLCSHTCFRRFRGRRVPFTCFASPYSFSAVASASGPVFMFCATGHVSAGMEGVGSCFHVLHSRTRFRRYRGRRVTFSFFDGTDDIGCRFHVSGSRTRFRRFRERRVSISCFACSYSLSAVVWASGLVLMFCIPGHVFGGMVGVGSRFHVLRSRTRFQRFRGRWVPFSCFRLLD
jgi:hypothetical protein